MGQFLDLNYEDKKLKLLYITQANSRVAPTTYSWPLKVRTKALQELESLQQFSFIGYSNQRTLAWNPLQINGLLRSEIASYRD